jgi:hypothetical protein
VFDHLLAHYDGRQNIDKYERHYYCYPKNSSSRAELGTDISKALDTAQKLRAYTIYCHETADSFPVPIG